MKQTASNGFAPRGTSRSRRTPTRQPARRGLRTLARDARAVSPVVGMILVLGISVVGIVSILYWGLPAIAELKSQVEFQAVTNQFQDLDSAINELIRGSPGNTAKTWDPSFTEGSIQVINETERWVVGVDESSSYNFSATGLLNRDDAFTLHNDGASSVTLKVRAWTLDGGRQTPLHVSTCTTSTQMSPTAVANNGSLNLCLYNVDGTPLNVSRVTLKLLVTDTGTGSDASVFYVADVGAIRYAMTLGPTVREAWHTNGAFLEGHAGDLALTNQPPFGPPSKAGSTTRFFGRLVELQGSINYGGSGRFNMLLSLYSTNTLADLQGARALKVWINGTSHDPWFTYLEDPANGYAFHLTPSDAAGGPAYLTYAPSGGFDVKLLYSIINVQG